MTVARYFGQTGSSSRRQLQNLYGCRIVKLSQLAETDWQELRFDLWFLQNALFSNEKFSILFHAVSEEPGLGVRDDPLAVVTGLLSSPIFPWQRLHLLS